MSRTPRTKTPLMTLPQHPGSKNPNREEKDHHYKNFRNRVNKKNNHAYYDNAETPELLRLKMTGSIFDSVTEILVVYHSFKIKYGNTGIAKEKELGFEAILRTGDDLYYKLTVLKEQYTAKMVEIIEEKK